jgi:hypothetical protein
MNFPKGQSPEERELEMLIDCLGTRQHLLNSATNRPELQNKEDLTLTIDALQALQRIEDRIPRSNS